MFYRPRRLPVFFLLDTSKEMSGTFQVTLRDGLLVVKHEITRSAVASQHVYMAACTFGEQATVQGLVPAEAFLLPSWYAQGQCHLKPALLSLTDALTYDLLANRPDRPGDFAPLVFLIVGDDPSDSWEDTLQGLAAINDNRRPLIITLVSRPELVRRMRVLSHHVLLLQPAEAASMTNFFFWVAHVIIKVCADCEQGATAVDFPALPYGVVVPL
jgi:uncharacterized protein YegL